MVTTKLLIELFTCNKNKSHQIAPRCIGVRRNAARAEKDLVHRPEALGTHVLEACEVHGVSVGAVPLQDAREPFLQPSWDTVLDLAGLGGADELCSCAQHLGPLEDPRPHHGLPRVVAPKLGESSRDVDPVQQPVLVRKALGVRDARAVHDAEDPQVVAGRTAAVVSLEEVVVHGRVG